MTGKKRICIRLEPWQVDQLEHASKSLRMPPTTVATNFVMNGLNGQTILERHLLEQAGKEQTILDQLVEKVHRIEALAFASLQIASEAIDKDLRTTATRGVQIRDDWASTRAKTKQQLGEK